MTPGNEGINHFPFVPLSRIPTRSISCCLLLSLVGRSVVGPFREKVESKWQSHLFSPLPQEFEMMVGEFFRQGFHDYEKLVKGQTRGDGSSKNQPQPHHQHHVISHLSSVSGEIKVRIIIIVGREMR